LKRRLWHIAVEDQRPNKHLQDEAAASLPTLERSSFRTGDLFALWYAITS
jgi:hypothetical protein